MNLEFKPSSYRSWQSREVHRKELGINISVYVSGWISTNQGILKGKDFAEFILDRCQNGVYENLKEDLSYLLVNNDGNFAIVVCFDSKVWAITDLVRTIPLFWSIKNKSIVISDDITYLVSDSKLATDYDSIIEMLASGYVTDVNTVYKEVKSIRPAEILICDDSDQIPNIELFRYFTYKSDNIREMSHEENIKLLDKTTKSAFEVILNSLNGSKIIIPLSGGLDSRLIALTLKRLKYENVLCISYGTEGNKDSISSRETAEKLGFPWEMIPYTKQQHVAKARDDKFWRFSEYASNGTSLPHIDDWIALNQFRNKFRDLSDAVFMPGHTGDFISGGHLKYLNYAFDDHHESSNEPRRSIIDKHYSLWGSILKDELLATILNNRISDVLEKLNLSGNLNKAQAYEFWEWQERQSKYIVNSVRSYEFHGYQWRIPLWSTQFVRFWSETPLMLKYDQSLYKDYLISFDDYGIYSDIKLTTNKTSKTNINNNHFKKFAKQTLNKTPLASNLLKKRSIRKKFEYQYDNHPLGMPLQYDRQSYVKNYYSKRHHVSLWAKEFIEKQYDFSIEKMIG
ncbi:MAG: asparagine synthase [SAR202 cluster bacterium]|nr:asparagine synthase [SAR202 cluster bacterium]|tara:strand:- start:106 stop:1812 length:1707 start_codon:yes stop_codon:yes gene_type:complete